MSATTFYKITPKTLEILKAEKISINELHIMLSKAAITSSSWGNRRFHQWVFDLRGDTLHSMVIHNDPLVGEDGSSLRAHDDCPECDGEGCKACGYKGEVATFYNTKRNKL